MAERPDPHLAPLGDNGGPTLTQLPQVGSPAIDRGGECPGADQRGASRPVDGDESGSVVCDVGAVEVQLDDPETSETDGSGAGLGDGSARPARALPLTPAFTG